jgi:hypothetical protein
MKKINRAKLKRAQDNIEYNMIMKNIDLYCYICVRRAGSYEASCHPSSYNPKGWKGRMYQTWKHNRKNQWK